MTHDGLDEVERAAKEEAEAARKKAEQRSTNRWAIGIFLTVAALCGLCLWGADTKEAPLVDLYSDAERVCEEEFIPKRLKAPASAKFTDVSVDADGDIYTVTGSVDAQNSFGALIRSDFTCVVQSAGDKWVLQSATVS